MNHVEGQGLDQRYAANLMNAYGPPKLVLARGQGSHVWDVNGREYVDLLGGIAVNSVGHAHPRVVAAVSEQLSTLGHISNFFASVPQIELAEQLSALVGVPTRAFFTNSGTEANEAAFKLTRRTGRTKIVAAMGGFHGRTMGSLALTHKPAIREPFAPLPGDVTFVPHGDAAALAEAVDDQTAAIVLEPIQGEAGVVVPPRDYLPAARQIADQHGALLWFDEIQSGIARTGSWFAHQHPDVVGQRVVPDIVTIAKGLGGGFPIGVCLAVGDVGELFAPGNHGTTFGGNPPAAAAGLAVLATIRDEGLMDHAATVGERLRAGLRNDPRVADVRGLGLLIGLDLVEDKAPDVVVAAQAAGYILNAPAPARIRLAPPLVLTESDVDQFVADWPGILDSAGITKGSDS